MIKFDEIEIVGNGKTLSYYKKLGYNIKCNEKTIIKIQHLIKTSSLKIDCYCDICNSLQNIKYYNYTRNVNKNGLYRCNECTKKIRSNSVKLLFQDSFIKKNIINKSKKTNLEKYGMDNYSKTDEYKEKFKRTNLEKYGVDSPCKLEFFKNKIKETNILKYGIDSYSKTDEYKEKFKKTNLEKYGVKNPFESEIIKDKIKKTNLERYGVDNPMKNINIFTKAQKNSFKIIKHRDHDISYQGTYELDFIEFCIENSIDFEQGPTIDYILNNHKRKYYSDFFIPSKNLICEIKSNWTYNMNLDENDVKRKFSEMSGYNFLFIIDKNYNEFSKILNIINNR